VTEFDAVYYDGRTSAKNIVRAHAADGHVHIAGAAVNLALPLAGASVDPPLAGVVRAIRFANGAQLRTEDSGALDALFASPERVERFAHALEGRWRYALAGFALVAAVTAWAVVYGLPAGAALVADAIPETTQRAMGGEALRTIDRTLCKPSALDPRQRDALLADFRKLTVDMENINARIEVRSCPSIGPNAFALPGGIVVVTDQLAGVLDNDAELTAVLAHELGHVRYRHPMRAALQSAGAAALVSALAGDAVSITGIVVTLPTLLLQTGYSRGFEDDADTYAFERLKTLGIAPRAFADALTALERAHATQLGALTDAGKALPDYLSTHPSTQRRFQRALAAL
jgi:Zn-dependent protease with chaperone function